MIKNIYELKKEIQEISGRLRDRKADKTTAECIKKLKSEYKKEVNSLKQLAFPVKKNAKSK